MALLDGILGGGDSAQQSESANDFGADVATNPQTGLSLSDVLSFDSSDDDGDTTSFTGIGGLDLGFAAPTLIGLSSSSEQSSASASESDDGLLGGIL